MWRTRAVISMLVEDVAGLGLAEQEDPQDDQDLDHPEVEPLARAIRRARLVLIVDLVAVLILFFFRDDTRAFLPADQTIEIVFTFGVLAVAIHAGFRWARLDRLQTIKRLCSDLRDRQHP